MNTRNGIKIQNISFYYGEKPVFENYSAFLNRGELSVLMAPSGSGKTTLLYLIAGLLQPQAGRITYSGMDLQERPRCSMVFQEDRLIDFLSVRKNIELVRPRLEEAELSECLEALGLGEYAGKKVRLLSGGERRRVAIARALMADYDILLLDEPFTGLDDDTKGRVVEFMKKSAAGKTVLLVTHDKAEAELMSEAAPWHTRSLRLSDNGKEEAGV